MGIVGEGAERDEPKLTRTPWTIPSAPPPHPWAKLKDYSGSPELGSTPYKGAHHGGRITPPAAAQLGHGQEPDELRGAQVPPNLPPGRIWMRAPRACSSPNLLLQVPHAPWRRLPLRRAREAGAETRRADQRSRAGRVGRPSTTSTTTSSPQAPLSRWSTWQHLCPPPLSLGAGAGGAGRAPGRTGPAGRTGRPKKMKTRPSTSMPPAAASTSSKACPVGGNVGTPTAIPGCPDSTRAAENENAWRRHRSSRRRERERYGGRAHPLFGSVRARWPRRSVRAWHDLSMHQQFDRQLPRFGQVG